MEETEDPWKGLSEDEKFDRLNEGLMAMQIIEWFEKKHPAPEWEPEDTDEWIEWQQELVLYADGWKDALKALKERREMERAIGLSEGAINFHIRHHQNPVEMLVWRHKFDDEHLWPEERLVLRTLGYDIEEEFENEENGRII